MKLVKNFKKFLVSALCAIMAFCTGLFAFTFNGDNGNVDALTEPNTSSSVLNIGSLTLDNYANRDHTFDTDKLNQLYKAISGTASYDSLATAFSTKSVTMFGSQVIQGSTIYANAGNKDVVVNLGGIDWVVVSATIDTNGEYVATLLQKDVSSTAIKYNLWNASNTNTAEAPSSLYATSYIRNYGLGIEDSVGYYATAASATTSTDKSSTYQVFTKTKDQLSTSLRRFLDTPEVIKYQETQNPYVLGAKYTHANDFWGTPGGTANWNTTTNTARYLPQKAYYDEWKSDPIWIPSLSEIGLVGTDLSNSAAIWGATLSSLRTSQVIWQRTAYAFDGAYAVIAQANNTTYKDPTTASNRTTVSANNVYMQPAIHLNLTAANKDKVSPVEVKDQTYVYNGGTRLFTSLPDYDASKMTYTVKDSTANNTDVGEYKATIKLFDGYYVAGMSESDKETEVTIKITPQPIAAPVDFSYKYTDDDEKYDIDSISKADPTKVPWYNASRLSLDYGGDDKKDPKASYSVTVSITPSSTGKINYYFEGHDTSVVQLSINVTLTKRIINPKGFSVVFDGKSHEEDYKLQSWYTEYIEDNLITIETDSGDDWINANKPSSRPGFKVVLNNPESVSFEGEAGGTESKTFYVEITKKPIAIQALQIDNSGGLESPIALAPSYSLCAPDTIETLSFSLQYKSENSTVWTTNPPTAAGSHRVKAVLADCNYELISDENSEIAWVKGSKPVDVPFVVLANNENTEISTVKYSGLEQIFKLAGLVEEDVIISNCSSNLKYNNADKTFSATNFGDYSITIALADGGLGSKWKDGNTNVSRVLKFSIAKEELEVSVDDTATSWQLKERENFTLTIKNVKDKDRADIDFSIKYSKDGGDKIEIATSKQYEENGDLTLTLNVGQFDLGKYSLYIELTNSTANSNYTIKNITPTGQVAEFLVTASVISNIDIEWVYSNLLLGHNLSASTGYSIVNSTGVCTPFEINFNGQEFELKLNELKLPYGVTVSYTNERITNSGTYTTTATLSVADGYEISNAIPTTYTIEWKINARPFDLGTINWQKEFEFNGRSQEPTLGELESWMSATKISTSEITSTVGTYSVKYRIVSSEPNNEFVNSSGYDYIKIVSKTIAEITLKYDITLAKILISQENSDWIEVTRPEVVGGLKGFIYYIPKLADIGSIHRDKLKLTFYEAVENSTSKVIGDEEAMRAFEIPDGIKLFYVRVELKDEYKDRYVIFNPSKEGADYATYEFYVGDNRPKLEVNYNYDEAIGVEYNGMGHAVIVTPNAELEGIEFNVFYYKQGSSGETPLGVGELPTEVGTYRISVSDKGGIYNITNRFFYLKITPLQVHVDGWILRDGTKPPVPTLNAHIDPQDEWFRYEISDRYGNLVDASNLKSNSAYTIKLVVSDFAKDFVQIENEEACVYEFRTEINSDEAIDLGIPELFDSEIEWTGEDIRFAIKDYAFLLQYAEIDLEASDELTQNEIGVYKIVLKIKDGESAYFQGSASIKEITITFSITKKVIQRPYDALYGELVYFGGEINILQKIYGESWNDILKFVDVVEDDENYKYIQTNAGKYILKLKIKEEYVDFVEWSESLTRELDNEEIEFEWEIQKAQIVGKWDNSNGYPTLKLEDVSLSSMFTVKYYDANGKEVAPKNMTDGQKYTYELVLNNPNYEFVIEGEVLSSEEMTGEFNFVAKTSMLNSVLDFLKVYWWILVIVLVVIILLIIIIVIAKRKKRKKEENLMNNPNNPNGYGVPPYPNQNMGQMPPYGQPMGYGQPPMGQPPMGYPQQPMMPPQMPPMGAPMGYPQQPMMNPYMQQQPMQPMMPQQPYQQMPQGGFNMYDMRQDNEIQQLKAQVKELTKDRLASTEEKQENKDLENVENMLKQFLLSNFDDQPVWVPFNKDDMVDYPIESLMSLYAKAKQVANEKVNSQAAAQPQPAEKEQKINFEEYEKVLAAEAAELERKVAEYQKLKEESGYNKLLEEVRAKLAQVDDAKKQMEERQRELDELSEKLKNRKSGSDDSDSQKKN